MCAIGSIKSHYFHIMGDKLIDPIVGVYIPSIRIPYYRWDGHPQYNEFRPWLMWNRPNVAGRRIGRDVGEVGNWTDVSCATIKAVQPSLAVSLWSMMEYVYSFQVVQKWWGAFLYAFDCFWPKMKPIPEYFQWNCFRAVSVTDFLGLLATIPWSWLSHLVMNHHHFFLRNGGLFQLAMLDFHGFPGRKVFESLPKTRVFAPAK